MKTNLIFKWAAIFAFLLGSFNINAQDLSKKIPADALAVITLKGNNLTKLLSVEEFNHTFLGEKVLNKLSRSGNKTFKSLDDLGFDLSSTFYYYNQSNDSVTYNCFLAPVKNVAQVDELYSGAGKSFHLKGKIRTYCDEDSTGIVIWDEQMLLFVKAEEKSGYFSRPDVRKRFGLSAYDASAAAAATAVADSAAVVADQAMTVAVDSAVTVVQAQQIPQPEKPQIRKSKSGKTKKNVKKGQRHPRKKRIIKAPVVKDVEPKEEMLGAVEETVPASADSSYYADLQIKKRLLSDWAIKKTEGFFNEKTSNSIQDNKDFKKSIDPNAEVTVWISGADRLLQAYLPQSNYFKGINFLNGYGTANARLYLNEQSIKINTSITFSQDMARVFKKVNGRKINKEFLNYLNEDKLIGYVGYAMDSKAYLEEYPGLTSRMYASSPYADEISLATDLISLLLDEQAVSKVVKGDVLFAFNGLKQREVSYKTYEYNEENFETKEVQKTKKETLPDFLCMISTEDTRLINKLIAYGVKKQVVKNNGPYYELAFPKSPMTLYFTIRKGIIFLGSDAAEMEQIAVLSAMGDIYLKSDQIEGDTFSGEVSMDIPAGQKNALTYLISLHPGGPLNAYKNNKLIPEGVSVPSSIVLYSLKKEPLSSFFCVLKINDSAALKKYLKNSWKINQFSTDKGGNSYGHSTDGRLNVACNANELAFSYSLKKTQTKDVLTDLLNKNNLLDPQDPRLQLLKKEPAEFSYIFENYKGTCEFHHNLLQLRGTIPTHDLNPRAQSVSALAPGPGGVLKFWLNANLEKTFSKTEFNLKGHVLEKARLMKYYGGYIDAEIKNTLSQTDSVITYVYNDDFEKTAQVQLKEVQVPRLQVKIGSPEPGALFTYLRDHQFISEKGGWNRDLFPLYRVYASTGRDFLSLSTSSEKIGSGTMKPSPYFVYLDIDFNQMKKQKMFPFLGPYIENLEHLQLKGTKTGNEPGKIEMEILFNKGN
eukprot:gene10301-12640_t